MRRTATSASSEGWYLTHHLLLRAAERRISRTEILEALDDPEVTYCQDDYGPNRQVRQRGRLGVIVDRSTGAVITVVFRSKQLWIRQRVRGAV